MATKAKTTKKKTTVKRAAVSPETGRLTAAAATLFGGVVVVLIGTLQDNDDIKLLLIGFGAAFLVLGGVLVGMSTKPWKK